MRIDDNSNASPFSIRNQNIEKRASDPNLLYSERNKAHEKDELFMTFNTAKDKK